MNKFANIKKREIQSHTSIQKKNPGGRPKKSEEEKRSEKIYINLTKKEKEKIEKIAINEELPIGILVRKILKEKNYI
jgi:hypothetical protein